MGRTVVYNFTGLPFSTEEERREGVEGAGGLKQRAITS
jgi:hypothetical protein